MNGIECAFFGTLTRNAQTRLSKNGKPFTTFSVAVGTGPSRQYVSVIVFGDHALSAEALEENCRVYVEGLIETSIWTDREGNPKANLKVTSWHAVEVSKIGRRRPARKNQPAAAAAAEYPPRCENGSDFPNDDIPF